MPGWDAKVGKPTSSEYIIMVDAGPKQWATTLHIGLARLEMLLDHGLARMNMTRAQLEMLPDDVPEDKVVE